MNAMNYFLDHIFYVIIVAVIITIVAFVTVLAGEASAKMDEVHSEAGGCSSCSGCGSSSSCSEKTDDI